MYAEVDFVHGGSREEAFPLSFYGFQATWFHAGPGYPPAALA